MILSVFPRGATIRTSLVWRPYSSLVRGAVASGSLSRSVSRSKSATARAKGPHGAFAVPLSVSRIVTVPTCNRNFSTVLTAPHPLDPLSADEITHAAAAVRNHLGLSPDNTVQHLRFVSVSLNEPPKKDYIQGNKTPRKAEIVALNPVTGIASEYKVDLDAGRVVDAKDLPKGVQPLLTPEDCDLAEAIVQSSPEVAAAMRDRYNIIDMPTVTCDPWSIHLASEEDRQLTNWRDDGIPGRLVQTFLYHRQYGEGLEDNVYAHPIDIVPVVDLIARKVVTINGMERDPPIIPTASVQYHRNLVKTNSYLETEWRQDRLAPLDVLQPDGPSFTVTGNEVEWQKWKFRVGFNYREGLVLHDVSYDDRPILHRASLVEMAVPYADPHPPYQRKCAFDVGDYGLGFCANSLELGCDCLGHIHYFDAVLNDSQGNPVEKKKVICMHEEDNGVLWKHVEYRNGHNEARRGRELIISSIATVVNYEYLFYWHLRQDGCIDFKIKLSGELSTNLLSEGEKAPSHGVMVAPGVNAQIHQHMFVAKLDMAVDSHKNTVSEVNIYSEPPNEANPYGNAFRPKETIFETESDAQRICDSNTSRYWKISNAEGKVNGITGKPTAFKLQPFNFGPSQPVVFTDPSSAVSQKGAFATKHLWVTPHSDTERFPSGEYTVQGTGSNGLPDWTASNRNIKGEDVVLWHAFGVAHVPRPEDFPVMPCEITGFTLKPDGFFEGNPAIDLAPEVNDASKLAKGCCPPKA
ncbi:copper amine oxidase [Nitzschia inconspicua]|uniref:Amine oxidase n=1 Tax=Nitzschia inconspicua TaxID=303405 RepID=A0A9K3M0S1_9STRA|nr:copper amine oxidase [Nitzschia inconspicua]